MKYVRLPLYQDPNYSYKVSLGGVTKELSFRWSDRNKWHMSIRDTDGTPIVTNIKIVSDYPILADYQLEEYDITGYFLLIENSVTSGGRLDNSYSDMAKYYSLFYVYP